MTNEVNKSKDICLYYHVYVSAKTIIYSYNITKIIIKYKAF